MSRYIDGLDGSGKPNVAAKVAAEAISQLRDKNPAVLRFTSYLLHYFGVVAPDKEKVLMLAKEAISIANREDVERKVRIQCANNAAFSLLQFNEAREAEKLLDFISSEILTNPFVTATYGLFHLRKGDFSKGKALYDRAIQLAGSKILKARIRQRMAFELAKEYLVHEDLPEALYWVDRAFNEKDGYDYVRLQAGELKRVLMPKRLT